MPFKPEQLSFNDYRTLIQVLNHTLLETEDSEFHTLIGVPKRDGAALQQKLHALQKALK